MPFITDDRQQARPAFRGLEALDLSRDDPDFFRETIPAAFRTENLIGSALSRRTAEIYRRDAFGTPVEYLREEGFDPLTSEAMAGYEGFEDRFAAALTREQAETIRANIDRERADRQTLAEAGGLGFVAMLGAGLVDPTVLIPVGGQVRKGANLLSITGRFALAAAGGTAIQEAGLLATQEVRTGGEAALNIAGATFLGGILGGVAHPFLKSAEGGRAAANVADDMHLPRDGEPDWADPMQAMPAEDPQPAGTYTGRAGDGGAAARPRPTMDEQAIQGVLARNLGQAVRQQDPVLRSITSRSLRQRELIEELADIPAGLVKNEARWEVRTLPDGREQRYLVWGKRTEQSVESRIRQRDSLLGQSVTMLDDAYIRYLRGRERRPGDILASGVQSITRTLPSGRMTRPDFYAEVTRAMRRGDRHAEPEVQAAAEALRRDFIDPLKNEARDLGMFGWERVVDDAGNVVERPREPSVGDTADSWMVRVYNRERIAARRVEFTNIIQRHFTGKRDAAEARLAADATRADPRPVHEVEMDEFYAGKTDDELLDEARRTVDHILGGPSGRLSFDGPGQARGSIFERPDKAASLSGRFRPRVLDIRDEAIEEFLEDDLEHLLRVTQRSMVPDIELTRRFGSHDMEVQLKEVAEDYDRLIAAASGEAEVRALSKKKQNALRDIEGVRDRLRGTYALPGNAEGIGYRTARAAVSLNYLRLMGGVTISSLSDMPRAVLTHGIANAFRPMVSALTGDLRGLRGAMAELEDAGPGFEIVLNNRARAMADLMDDYGRYSKLERMVTAAQGHFGYASLIAPWNHAMKSVSGFAVMNRMLRAIGEAADGSISAKDMTLLSRLGIGRDDALQIAQQFRRHGRMEGGQRIANSRDWDSPALRERWLNAVRKEVDRLIVTPGQDKPLMASTALGRVIFQFRSYNFAATQRVAMAYLQGLEARDAHAIMALVTQIGMGMVVAALKANQYNLSTEDWTANKWLVEGIDRSGVLGVLTDVNMMAEHLTRGRIGLSRLAGEERLTRYQTRNGVGAWLGPSFGTATDIFTAVPALLSGDEVSKSDVAALRRLLPYQNLFWLRNTFDAVEAGAADALGAEE